MSDVKRKSDLETTYSKGQMRKDPFFGEYFTYNAIQGSSQIICVEKLFNDKESVLREVEAKKKKILNKHPNVLNLLDYSVEVQSNWCSTFYLLKLFYEWPEKTLKQAILERKSAAGAAGSFSMKEATNLLYNVIYACAFLQEKSVYHGDISPLTIFLTEKGEFKLAFRVNEQVTPQRAQIEKSIKNEPLYLSPTVFMAVKNRTFERSQYNTFKSDIFSLGLSILEMGLLKSVQTIYGLNDNFDDRALEELLGEFEVKYEDNPLLFTSVQKMLEINEEERPDFIGLKSALPEYEVILDYFYRVENGLIDEEEQENSNNSFNHQQNNADYNNYNNNYQNNFQSNPEHGQDLHRVDSMAAGHEMGYNFYDEQQPMAGQYQNGLQQGSYPPGNNQRLGSNSYHNSQNNSFNQPNSNSNRSDRDHSWNPVSPNAPANNQKVFTFQNQATNEPVRAAPKASPYQDDFFTKDYMTDYAVSGNQTMNTGTHAPYSEYSNQANQYTNSQQPTSYNQVNQQSANSKQYGNQQSYTPSSQFSQPQTYGQSSNNQPNSLFDFNPTPQEPQRQVQTNASAYSAPQQQAQRQYSTPQQPQQPTQSYQQPTQSYQQPAQSYQQPAQSYQSPPQKVATQSYTEPPRIAQAYQNQSYQPQQAKPTPSTQSSQQYNPSQQTQGLQVQAGSGNTKVINGQLYNEVREEINDVDASGKPTKKIVIRYTLANSQPQTATPRTNASYEQPSYGQARQVEAFFA